MITAKEYEIFSGDPAALLRPYVISSVWRVAWGVIEDETASAAMKTWARSALRKDIADDILIALTCEFANAAWMQLLLAGQVVDVTEEEFDGYVRDVIEALRDAQDEA